MLNLQKNKGFSLAEMMVVMLMLSIIFAAAAPILTKRATQIAEVKTSTGSGVPVGTVIIWPFETLPQGDEAGKWLECNGQSTEGYPELKAIAGENVPDYQNRFVQGAGTYSVGTSISAGLPNITGSIVAMADRTRYVSFRSASGAITYAGWANPVLSDEYYTHYNGGYSGMSINASRSSSIYGNSTTVQPPAVVAKYIIKAKS